MRIQRKLGLLGGDSFGIYIETTQGCVFPFLCPKFWYEKHQRGRMENKFRISDENIPPTN